MGGCETSRFNTLIIAHKAEKVNINRGIGGLIQARNLDYSSFWYREVHDGTLQITCGETGVYFIFGSINRNSDSLGAFDLCVNGTAVQTVALASTGSNGWRNWTFACITSVNKNEKVDIRNGGIVQSPQASGRASLCMFRVA